MTLDEIRAKYLKFFESRGHKIISPAPLVLENDPTTLFTSSGMQPLVPYLLGEKHPGGKRLVDSQPSIRLQDIEEVGDNRHTTFFEMLGNWSLGDYFKEEQLPWIWEFVTKELGLPKEKLYVSIFEGNDSVPRDEESFDIWKKIGLPEDHIFEYGVDKNWWSRSGTPEEMPAGEIGGPDSEIFFEFEAVEHDKKFGEKCHPNCDCGRFLEIGNSVFIQYEKQSDGSLKELPQKNVDFGGGLERIAAAVGNEPDVFKIDAFSSIVSNIEKTTGKTYKGNEKKFRIIADHLRASEAIIKNGVEPSNKRQGYVLRRLIRRAAINLRSLQVDVKTFEIKVSDDVKINDSVSAEISQFSQSLDKGLPKFKNEYLNSFNLNNKEDAIKLINNDVKPFSWKYDDFLNNYQTTYGNPPVSLPSVAAGTAIFYGTTTYGLPYEKVIPEVNNSWPEANNPAEINNAFNLMNKKHQDLSRTASAGTFKGGLADSSEETTQLHTATHLLHESLRRVLGDHVQQKGSNITAERLRFDFVHSQKLTDAEIKKVEDLVNEQIAKGLPVTFTMMTLEEADKAGALHFFDKKYDEQVKVYSIGDFSKEVCGGPHVGNTADIKGRVRITKEESASSGVRRIYAVIE